MTRPTEPDPVTSYGVQVRYRARELSDTPEYERFTVAVQAEVLDDRTLMLYDDEGRVVGMVHPDRWDSFTLILEDE